MKTIILKLVYDENIDDVIPEMKGLLNDNESLTEIHLPADDEINFLLTLINLNGKGEHYAYPGWEDVVKKLETLKQI